jgi:hypothetical protein
MAVELAEISWHIDIMELVIENGAYRQIKDEISLMKKTSPFSRQNHASFSSGEWTYRCC